jgi:hypothetical protein
MISVHHVTRVVVLGAEHIDYRADGCSAALKWLRPPALADASDQSLHLPSSARGGQITAPTGRSPVHYAVDIAVDNFVDNGADRWRARGIPKRGPQCF